MRFAHALWALQERLVQEIGVCQWHKDGDVGAALTDYVPYVHRARHAKAIALVTIIYVH